MTLGFWAYGSQIQLGDGIGGFTPIAEVLDFGTPPATREKIDMSNHSSPNGYRERIPGFKDTGDLTFDVNWIPDDATHDNTTGVTSLYDSGELRPYKIVCSDDVASEVDFEAYVIGFTGALPLNAGGRGTITLMPTGVVTWP